MKTVNLRYFLAVIFCLSFLSIAGAGLPEDINSKILVRSLVNQAVELIKREGQSAVEIIGDKNGRFNTKDAYVFVTSETGADLINSAFKEIEGMPLETYSDEASKEAQIAIVNAVKDKDSAWIEYLWPRPGDIKPSKKISYLQKITINGKIRIVGAGFYPQENQNN
jgi:methyl-accepting chemotaxis protein